MLLEFVLGYLAVSCVGSVICLIIEEIKGEINCDTTKEVLKKNGFSDSLVTVIDNCSNVITVAEAVNPNKKIKIKGTSISSEMKQGMTISGRR